MAATRERQVGIGANWSWPRCAPGNPAVLSEWLSSRQDTLPGALALDGKMIRDSVGTVSLVDVEDGAPVAVSVMEQKENTTRCELKVARELLAAVPSLEGKTVTADALHCQKTRPDASWKSAESIFCKSKPPSVI